MTLWQPWASLIAEGVKTIETRPKRSPWSSAVGETIAIHAAVRRPDTFTLGEWHCDPRYRTEPRVPAEPRIWRSLTQPGDLFGTHESRVLPLGAIVATCTLVDVVPMAAPQTDEVLRPGVLVVNPFDPRLRLYPDAGREGEDVSEQLPFGDFAPGRWAVVLDNVQKCAPFPCRGYQGLWTVPDAVAENLMAWCA